jgi:hypothetical protein
MANSIYTPFISRPLGGHGARSGFSPRASAAELQRIVALGGRPREDLSPSQARMAVRALLARQRHGGRAAAAAAPSYQTAN